MISIRSFIEIKESQQKKDEVPANRDNVEEKNRRAEGPLTLSRSSEMDRRISGRTTPKETVVSCW